MSGGVLSGARTPHHSLSSKPGRPLSAKVGTSGAAVERWAPVVPIGRSWPVWMNGRQLVGPLMAKSIWPPSRSWKCWSAAFIGDGADVHAGALLEQHHRQVTGGVSPRIPVG